MARFHALAGRSLVRVRVDPYAELTIAATAGPQAQARQ
jgi:hypothetical protein